MSATVDRLIHLLEQIRDNTEGGGGTSSIEIEDLASKPEPKVTTKVYVGCPLTTEDIEIVLSAHAYAKRRAKEMALTGWQETVDMLKVRAAAQREAELALEDLPDFEALR